MSDIPKVESSETIKTTDSMKKKAHVLGRCLINILKFWKMCKKHKKTQNNIVSA
jgi:hypothetical protein